jgi:hypothetical protein
MNVMMLGNECTMAQIRNQEGIRKRDGHKTGSNEWVQQRFEKEDEKEKTVW